MTIFREKIRQSIADENLQAALDANAERRRKGREAAFASIPDYPERRARAHAIKADVVARLDEYLAQFIANVEKNGILVHRAGDAAEANKIVLDITQYAVRSTGIQVDRYTSTQVDTQHAPRNILIAKSKSMVSEEINLNHALEEHGIRVVETDLGEYIVQLRGERPSHIITPAVHLRRGDVGRLFHEKLGIPYTEDIPTLTNTARRVLRDVFLTADIGVSGVNFGVAETGTLCIVTNEGNGRMVTTLPPVHVALMGIERLVPTLDDLALFLSLLPRSATGQKMSVYASLIHSPRRIADPSTWLEACPDGPQERHLILLDNGRSAIRHSPLAESLYCIRCGACLNACPVFREIGGHAYGSIYPGPIGSVISCALVDPKFAYLAQASSLCGACREACPVDIDLPGLLLRVRAGHLPVISDQCSVISGEGRGLPSVVKLGLKLYRRVAASPRLFRLVLRTLGLFPLPQWIRLPAWTGWGYSKDFPRLTVRPFRARWKNVKQSIKETGKQLEREQVGKETSRQVERKQVDRETGTAVAQFTKELTALGGQAYLVSEQELPARLTEFLQSKGVERVQADESVAKYITGILAVREPDPTIRAGVTGALAGIADTGSLVIVSGQARPLTASLLPEIHVVVLKTSQILPTVADALCRPEVREAAAGVIVTGPSRTADIEMTLTLGVHGPGELHVFLIDDSTSG